MSTVTLQEIKATRDTLVDLIAKFEAQAAQSVTPYTVREAVIELAAGERYAGLALAEDGSTSHHLVLLPGAASDVTWQDAKAWAENAGGELPTRQEQALLYANLKAEFESAWYWSADEYSSDGSSAWTQYFNYCTQLNNRKGYEGRARAVRRFPA